METTKRVYQVSGRRETDIQISLPALGYSNPIRLISSRIGNQTKECLFFQAQAARRYDRADSGLAGASGEAPRDLFSDQKQVIHQPGGRGQTLQGDALACAKIKHNIAAHDRCQIIHHLCAGAAAGQTRAQL